MQRLHVELATGIFLIIGILCLGYLSLKLGQTYSFGQGGYTVTATFGNVGGLNKGAPVESAGVPVGQVKTIQLQKYQAAVKLQISKDITLRRDAIAAIKTQGLIGEKFISISPGGAPDKIQPGGKIRDTQSAVNLRDLISRFMFKSEEL